MKKKFTSQSGRSLQEVKVNSNTDKLQFLSFSVFVVVNWLQKDTSTIEKEYLGAHVDN